MDCFGPLTDREGAASNSQQLIPMLGLLPSVGRLTARVLQVIQVSITSLEKEALLLGKAGAPNPDHAVLIRRNRDPIRKIEVQGGEILKVARCLGYLEELEGSQLLDAAGDLPPIGTQEGSGQYRGQEGGQNLKIRPATVMKELEEHASKQQRDDQPADQRKCRPREACRQHSQPCPDTDPSVPADAQQMSQ